MVEPWWWHLPIVLCDRPWDHDGSDLPHGCLLEQTKVRP
jgi:hypothetical protein